MDKIEKIITLLESGNHEEAIRYYNDILLNGSNEERFVLAEEMFQLGFLEETKSLLAQLLTSYPEEGELLVLYAEACLELGLEEEAMLTLEKVCNTDHSFPQSLLLLADLYQMQGLYEVSEQKLLLAKKTLPNEILVDFALGELYLEQGRFTEAIRMYELVLKEEDEVAGINIHQRMAEALSAGGAFEEALKFYEQALDDHLEINTLFGYAFTALQAGYNRTAIEKFEEVKVLDPEYHSLYLNLAKAYEREEELTNAVKTIEEGLKYDDFNKDLYFYGGKIAIKSNQPERAEHLLRQALVLDPEFIEAALSLNKVLFIQEKYDDALEIIELMKENGIEDPEFIWDEAHALAKIENFSLALNKYQHAYNFFKNQQDFLSEYGYFLNEEGKRDKAAEIFSMLLQMDPSNEEFAQMLQSLTGEW